MSTVPEDVYERLRNAEDKGLRNELGLEKHEEVCAERYKAIHTSISGQGEVVSAMRRDLRAVAIASVSGMVTIIGFLVKLVFFKP